MKPLPLTHTAILGSLLIACHIMAHAQDGPQEAPTTDPDITIVANGFNQELGSALSTAGDINGDGVTDFAVADRSATVNGKPSLGAVYIASGVDGSILRTYVGSTDSYQSFGNSLASLDSNGDGVDDLAIGSPGRAGGAGSVTIYSGKDGSILADVLGSGQSQLGVTIANAGDQNGDGVEDLFVGASQADNAKGQVLTISGSNGALIRTLSTDAARFAGFGSAIAATDDIDGDGRKELVVATPGYNTAAIYGAGRVQLIRSSDSGTRAEVLGLGTFTRLGTTLAPVADANGDGVSDLLVGSFWNATLLLVSGADLSVLRNFALNLGSNRGVEAGGSVDFNGDGVEDWLIGSTGMTTNELGYILGGIRIISGVDESVLFEMLAETPVTGLGRMQTVLPGIGFGIGERRLRNPETGGYGAAYIWKVVDQVPDSDGDGIPDDEDENPNSNMNPTVLILGRDTGVGNFVGGNGVTLADLFDDLGTPGDYGNPTHYFTSVVHLANELIELGLLTDTERKLINAAARDGAVKSKGRGR